MSEPAQAAPSGGLRFDRTINLPMLLTLATLGGGGLWWTAGQSSRVENTEKALARAEIAILAVRQELNDRVGALRGEVNERIGRIEAAQYDAARQNVEQWREIDRQRERLAAIDAARLEADRRIEVQVERALGALNSLREDVRRLMPQAPPQRQSWDDAGDGVPRDALAQPPAVGPRPLPLEPPATEALRIPPRTMQPVGG